MRSTVLKAGACALWVLACAAFGADQAPQSLRVPAIGLRYKIAAAHFEPVANKLLSPCSTLADNDNMHSMFWVYAKVNDEKSTYYIIGGYGIRSHPEPGFPMYEDLDLGTVIQIDGKSCRILGEAHEVFAARYFDEIPQHVMHLLADDLAARTGRAFGGKSKVQAELKRQHLNPAATSPELAAAFK
jgi:hypothetical protein